MLFYVGCKKNKTKEDEKMNKNKVIVAVIFVLALFATITAMSDDGEQQPVKPEKKTEVTQVQNEQVQQTGNAVNVVNEEVSGEEKTGDRVTVKDRLCVDTGMTQAELVKFQAEYYKKAQDIGINEGRYITFKDFFKFKVNLNVADELKKLGLLLTKDPFIADESFAFNVTNSDIILVGTIEKIEYLYSSKEEELNTDTSRSKYTVIIEEILKGENCFEAKSERIQYLNAIGKYINVSHEQKQLLNKKYILFFEVYDPSNIKNSLVLRKKHSSLRIENDGLYHEDSNYKFAKSFSEVSQIIEKYNKINNNLEFYKRKYIGLEVKNEK